MIDADEVLGFEIDRLADILMSMGERVATVESCTGGALSGRMTDLPGSSIWFDRGFVTYSNAAKQSMVGVSGSALKREGAVSELVAREMAVGGVGHSEAEWAVSITGVAGPGGGTLEKPVGIVCFAVAKKGGACWSFTQKLNGNRQQVRTQSMIYAVQQLQVCMVGSDAK